MPNLIHIEEHVWDARATDSLIPEPVWVVSAQIARERLAAQSALLEEMRKAGNELVQSRLHQDVCIAEYKACGGPVHAQAVSESSCRVADAIEAWELILTKLPNPTK